MYFLDIRHELSKNEEPAHKNWFKFKFGDMAIHLQFFFCILKGPIA